MFLSLIHILTGMGIKKGITLIVGGGYHGKSTLLKALETGVYNHIAGDGREYVLSLIHIYKFFERLLNKQSYDELLKEHLEGYVEEVVRRKYHILKTSDNFYIYKMDIKRWLKEMREDDAWVERIRQKQQMEQKSAENRSSVLDSRRTEEELPFLYTRRNRQEDV